MKNNLLNQYHEAVGKLLEYRKLYYKSGTNVMVHADKYDGPGIIVPDSLVPVDKIAVQIPNGNVWYYDMADVDPDLPYVCVKCGAKEAGPHQSLGSGRSWCDKCGASACYPSSPFNKAS